MKDFLEALEKDYKSEQFTKLDWIMYGFLVPAMLVALCLMM